MISVTELSRHYASLWKRTFPFINKLVRKLNLQKTTFFEKLESDIDASRRALVNEIGFRVFEKSVELEINSIDDIDESTVKTISEKSCQYISGLEKTDSIELPNSSENDEAIELAKRTKQFFNDYEKGSSLVVSPLFLGCGAVSSCFGDVLSGDTLYEIKAGEREFRVSDLKQLLLYCTLNFSNHNEDIQHIALVNPRLGIFVKLSLKESVELSSGKSVADAFYELINHFDNPDDFL